VNAEAARLAATTPFTVHTWTTVLDLIDGHPRRTAILAIVAEMAAYGTNPVAAIVDVIDDLDCLTAAGRSFDVPRRGVRSPRQLQADEPFAFGFFLGAATTVAALIVTVLITLALAGKF
jgi:hypothetical protein